MYLDNKVENFIKNSLKWNPNFITKLSKLNGLNNENYKVNYLGMDYFLSIKGDYFNKECINTYAELLKLTDKKELSYNLVHIDLETGDLLSKWIEGDTPDYETLNCKEFIKNLCHSLRDFHSINIEKSKNPFHIINNMYEKCLTKDIDTIVDIKPLLKKSKAIEDKYKNKVNFGLCHYDLNPSNIIYHEGKISLIDLEFSSMGDIFWDLATITWMMDSDSKSYLLNTYFADDMKPYYIDKLNDYLFVVKLWNALWSLLKSAEPYCPYDYRKGAEIILNELQQ